MFFYFFISLSIIHKVLYFLSPIPNHFNKCLLLFSLISTNQYKSQNLITKSPLLFSFITTNQYKCLLLFFLISANQHKSHFLFITNQNSLTKVTYSFPFISINQYKSIFPTYHCLSHIYSTPQQFSHWLSNFLYLLVIKNNCI